MTDKQTILIAGATGNIGGGAVVALAKRGARVVLLGRKLERLDARADSIRVALSKAQIDYQDTDIATLTIDFSDMESVRLAAGEALSRFPMVNGLILSAVVHIQNGPNILPNGHEVMFATNVMGPFLFTQLLLKIDLPPKAVPSRPEASVMGLWGLSEGTGKAYPGGS